MGYNDGIDTPEDGAGRLRELEEGSSTSVSLVRTDNTNTLCTYQVSSLFFLHAKPPPFALADCKSFRRPSAADLIACFSVFAASASDTSRSAL